MRKLPPGMPGDTVEPGRNNRRPRVFVRVELFGRAASQTGQRGITLEVTSGATLRDVANLVVMRHPELAWIPTVCRPARNLDYAAWTDPVENGDEISFIAPTSGG